LSEWDRLEAEERARIGHPDDGPPMPPLEAYQDNIVPIRSDIGELPAFKATPFAWRSEADIPARKWLYGRHLLRKFLSVDVAAGGVGKSSLKIGEALAMASNKSIYGKEIHEGALRVWLYNLEDPNEETERRIHATAKRFNITPDDIGDRLYVDSGRDQRCVIAEDTATGARIIRPMVDALMNEMMERRIDVLIIDPFVSSHTVSENDNMAIDMVAKEWGRIADACNCSINLVHHVRKQNGTEATADSARGASSLIGAARSVVVYNRMTPEEAIKASVAPDQARFYFRTDNDKANLAPPEGAEWYRMNNVDLDNGDAVGVACSWQMPALFDGISVRSTMLMQKLVGAGQFRENSQAKDWVGFPIAEALRLDPRDDKDKARIKLMLKAWIKEGVLEIVEMEDSFRKMKPCVIVGKWVTE
tara:strand:- start:17305 stop:18558 length:1254 start_codon:yes stop_codon:yes gene_type:complete